MKIESSGGHIRFDLTTPEGRRGNSSCLVQTGDLDTQVFYGGLHISVTFLDLGLVVVMDQYALAEDWRDAKYARAEALKAVRDGLTSEGLLTLLVMAEDRGFQLGLAAAQDRMRSALGL